MRVVVAIGHIYRGVAVGERVSDGTGACEGGREAAPSPFPLVYPLPNRPPACRRVGGLPRAFPHPSENMFRQQIIVTLTDRRPMSLRCPLPSIQAVSHTHSPRPAAHTHTYTHSPRPAAHTYTLSYQPAAQTLNLFRILSVLLNIGIN